MILQSADSEKALVRICDCKEQQVDASNTEPAQRHDDVVDDTTEIGFAAAAHMEVEKFRNPQKDRMSDEDPEAENLADA
jgi:hypothetical protein